MALSERAMAYLERVPAELDDAWAAAFRGKGGSGETTPEQRDLIADWVTRTVMNSPLPLPGEIWPPAFGRLRQHESDMFRR